MDMKLSLIYEDKLDAVVDKDNLLLLTKWLDEKAEKVYYAKDEDDKTDRFVVNVKNLVQINDESRDVVMDISFYYDENAYLYGRKSIRTYGIQIKGKKIRCNISYDHRSTVEQLKRIVNGVVYHELRHYLQDVHHGEDYWEQRDKDVESMLYRTVPAELEADLYAVYYLLLDGPKSLKQIKQYIAQIYGSLSTGMDFELNFSDNKFVIDLLKDDLDLEAFFKPGSDKENLDNLMFRLPKKLKKKVVASFEKLKPNLKRAEPDMFGYQAHDYYDD